MTFSFYTDFYTDFISGCSVANQCERQFVPTANTVLIRYRERPLCRPHDAVLFSLLSAHEKTSYTDFDSLHFTRINAMHLYSEKSHT